MSNKKLRTDKSEFTVIAGCPSVGKTTLAIEVAYNEALHEQKKVVYFTLGMSSEQLTKKLLCGISGISEAEFDDENYNEQKFESKWEKINDASIKLNNASLYIDPDPALNMKEIKSRIIKLMTNSDVNTVVIDYFQLIQPEVFESNCSNIDQLSKISKELKQLAKELCISLTVVLNMDRQKAKQIKPDHREQIKYHLKEYGTIGEDADLIIFMYREPSTLKSIIFEV